MNPPLPHHVHVRRLVPVIGISLWIAQTMTGQGATPPAAASGGTEPKSEEVIELSPFTVDASRDYGYYAENTLAGSRLNTNLGDIAASITVVTKQQLIDTAAVDMNDVFLYEANTEGTGNYTAFNVDTRGAVQDYNAGFQGGAPSLPFTSATSNRVRGIQAVDRARDFFPSIQRLPFDAYNTDSVEISRGPNSILFGLGSPAGIVNQSAAKADVRKAFNQLEFRIGSEGAFRSSFTANRPLVDDRLAVYVAGLYDAKGFSREPSYDITRRGYLAVTARPLKNTTIRASVEYYENRNRRPNTVTPRDFVSAWRAAGRPSYNPVTRQLTLNGVVQPTVYDGNNATADPSNALYPTSQLALQTASGNTLAFDGNNRPVQEIENGQLLTWISRQAWTLNAAGAVVINAPVRATKSQGPITQINVAPFGRPAGITFAQPGVTDKSVYDWDSINAISGNFGRDTATIYNAELEQKIIDDLYLQVGWYREDFTQKLDYYISQQTGVTLYVDTNSVNVDGSPNLNFGRPFVETVSPDGFDQPEDNDNVRATLAYKLDFTRRHDAWKWLGHHQIMGLGSIQYDKRSQLRYRPIVTSNNTIWNPPLADVWAGNTIQNVVERRFYLGDTNGRVTHDPGLYPNLAIRSQTLRYNTPVAGTYDPATAVWVNEPETVEERLHFVSSKAKQVITSRAIALQSFLLDDRLVLTAGERRDKSKARTSAGLTRLTNGYTDPANLDSFPTTQWVEGDTRSFGIVARPFEGWGPIDRAADSGSIVAKIGRSIDFTYNKSDNFTPAGVGTDFFNNLLPMPTGKGKDYGFGIAMFDNKLVARVNWFDTSSNQARGAALGQVPSRTFTVDDQYFRRWAAWVSGSTSAQSSQVQTITQLPASYVSTALGSFFNVPVVTTSTVDSDGLELQLIYNPNRSWNLKFTAGKQETVFSNIAPEWDAWVATRMPIWTSAAAPGFPNFWQTTGAQLNSGPLGSGSGLPDSQTVADWWFTNVGAVATTAKRFEGKVTQDQRKWRWNLISTYNFTEGRLSGFGVGGAARWEGKAAIGYLGSAPDPDGVIRSLDVNKPVYDDTQFHIDLWLRYQLRSLPWVGEKVKARVQLNVRDVFENGGLQPIAVNPDGSPFAYRIVEPRQWYLTTTFDF